jgi:hypothetical protein
VNASRSNDVIERTGFARCGLSGEGGKKRAPQNEGISSDLYENTCRKKVVLRICEELAENTLFALF